jgi:hypothetical protein
VEVPVRVQAESQEALQPVVEVVVGVKVLKVQTCPLLPLKLVLQLK